MNKIIGRFLFVFLLFSFIVKAQTPATYSTTDIYLRLQKLQVLGSVLYIAAHPDDENTRLLAYLSKEKLYRTGYLSLTRGDGGQNLIGNEQGIELGLIRTQELLSARRIDGAEQFFSRAYDFGYSKKADETFRFWNKEKILSDVVWIIRKCKPDIIITRFPGDERAGHGHHAASAILANEAFVAAADPNRFAEQLTGEGKVEVWQAKRILWNTFNFGGNNTTAADQFKTDVGIYNAMIGKGYGEIASESRSQHKSQGFGVPMQRGTSIEYFTTTGGTPPRTDLMDDIVTNWSRVEGGAEIEAMINAIIQQYSFAHPEQSVNALIGLYAKVKSMPTSYWQQKKLQEIQQLIEACTGLFAEAFTGNVYAVEGDSLKINLSFNNRNKAIVAVQKIETLVLGQNNEYRSLWDSSFNKALPFNENVNLSKSLFVPANIPVYQPYWLQEGMPEGSFKVSNRQLIGKAETDPSFIAKVYLTINGEKFVVTRTIFHKYTDPVKGELNQPLSILPPLVAEIDMTNRMMMNGKPISGKINFTSHKAGVSINLKQNIQAPVGCNIQFESDTLYFADANQTKSVNYTLSGNGKGSISISQINNQNSNDAIKILHRIRYDHIPEINYFSDAQINIHPVSMKVVGNKIGYIAGAGDKVPDALTQMGYKVTLIDEAGISAEKLKQYDAVITGIRAYNVYDYMYSKYNDLMDYVKNGGNLIVQYNTNNQLAGINKFIGPFPFTISRNRVSDETVPVTINLPNHSVMNFPNAISTNDFEGWVQERSIYQAEQTDSNYVAPFTMNDMGEKPSNGSLIIGKYGKGNFVYTGLVFFRQLPAGIPGAYRLMANLIALPKNK